MKYVIGVIGSRTFYDRSILNEILDTLISKYNLDELDLILCSGGAKGADQLAQSYAKENGLPILIYYPNYNRDGKKAPLVRNVYIINSCDLVISLWDGESTGTGHAMAIAAELNKKLIIYDSSTDELTKNYSGGIL